MATIRVLWVRVGLEPAPVDVEHELSELQRLVGGLLDCVALTETVDCWLGDESLLLGLPFNRLIPFAGQLVPVFGDFYIAGNDGEGNTVGLSDVELETWWRRLL
jgi:hypothetical protein